jgi:hypothetical protein
MFPNVRLMIVAVSASLLAVVCAMTLFMGMFAAFSVAHEPFSPPAGRPPLQIAFADESSAPVADGKRAPFGVRFQLNAPKVPNGPVIVVVPAALDRAPPPDAAAAAEPTAGAGPQPESTAAMPQDDTTVQASHDVQADSGGQAARSGDAKTNEARRDDANTDDVTAAVRAPAESAVSERPAVVSARQRIPPEIRIVAREAENPASVSTSPAPTLARKAVKRRKLAVHLHQSHHFRRPRIHRLASGYMQPNAFGQPSGLTQPNVNAFTPPGAYGPSNGYAQLGYQYTPTAIRPRPVKLRHAARNGSGNSAK